MKENDMRTLLGKMRGKHTPTKKMIVEKKNLTVRDMLKRVRKLNEEIDDRSTAVDQNTEEKKFQDFFDDLMVTVNFEPLEVYDSGIFWGGTIDNQVQWVYKVTPDESTSGYDVDYLDTFDKSNPENDEIIRRIENYYGTFYKYWRDNMLE